MVSGNLLTWFKAPVKLAGVYWIRLRGVLPRSMDGIISAASQNLPSPPPSLPGTVISLDYAVHPRARWGNAWGLPAHDILEKIIYRNDKSIILTLETIAGYREALRNIPVRAPEDHDDPRWINGWLPGLDGAALYALVRERRPAVYWEVGSGNSTRFVRQAIIDGNLPTRIISIDPSPRAEIARLCDEVLRAPLEDTCALWARICSGDICFIDCSHRAFQNSDVTSRCWN